MSDLNDPAYKALVRARVKLLFDDHPNGVRAAMLIIEVGECDDLQRTDTHLVFNRAWVLTQRPPVLVERMVGVVQDIALPDGWDNRPTRPSAGSSAGLMETNSRMEEIFTAMRASGPQAHRPDAGG